MAGLDSNDSPFNNSSLHTVPNLQKQRSKSNNFVGDISSSNHQINSVVGKNGNLRPKPYLGPSNTEDPTMKSGYLDDSHDSAQRRRDELYERILQETSNAFRNIGEQDLTVNITGESDRPGDDSVDIETARSEPDKGNNTDLLGTGSLRGKEGEIIRSLSPFDEDPVYNNDQPNESGQGNGDVDESRGASPNKMGHSSHDFSYGMDSFEQSYVSERGELIHLGDDSELYPRSPSPIRRDSDNDDF